MLKAMKEIDGDGEKTASFHLEPKNDDINRPRHYTQGDVECIDAIKASMSDEAFFGYLKGNVIKYIWRYRNKRAPLEDLKKADWYLKRLERDFESYLNK